MITPDSSPTAIDQLEDAIEADILATPKDELLADAVENGDDPAEFAARMRAWVDGRIRELDGRRAQL